MTMMYVISIILLVAISIFASGIISKINFVKTKKAENRFVHWEDLQKYLHEGRGTIIVNKTNVPGHIWWVDKAVTEDHLTHVLLFEALLTDAPRHFKDKNELSKEFPQMCIKELTVSIRTKK